MYDVSYQISCLREIAPVAEMLGYKKNVVSGLIFTRSGLTEDSHMTALGLHQVIGGRRIYQISKEQGLVPCKENDAPSEVKYLGLNVQLGEEIPKHLTIAATWSKKTEDDGKANNILGGNGSFFTQDELLHMPLVNVTDKEGRAALAYYGATLLQDRQKVAFEIAPYPVWLMSIGMHYVEDFLLKGPGGGFYVEYHNDKPHFHMPLSEDADGFYILGRKIKNEDSEEKAIFHFTAFKIPYGAAVYTSGGAIHCDAALTGKKWVVGYDIAEDFSTVILRTARDGKMVRVLADA